MILPILSKTRV